MLQTGPVYPGIDNIADLIYARVVEDIDLLESGVHDAADFEDEKQDYDIADTGKRNMPNHPQPAGAVHPGRFEQSRVDPADRGQIDDCAPADILPDFS
ncbi:hypothetical protein D3C85_1669870 [compost metagenome]